MKEIYTQEMTNKEIKEGLKLFSKYLSLYRINYTHANPIKENAYTSSSDIIGVFFPNTEFDKLPTHSHYDLCSVSKVGGELGLVFSLKDDPDMSEKAKAWFDTYIFEDFITLIYGSHFKRIKDKIEKRIKEYKKDLATLKSIKRVYKKDGGNFAKVLQNFDGANLYFDYCFFSSIVSSIKINYNLTIYRKDEKKEVCSVPTIEEIEELIQERTTQYMTWIADEEKQLKNLERDFLRFKKICDQIKDFRGSVSHWYDFKEEMDYMTLN